MPHHVLSRILIHLPSPKLLSMAAGETRVALGENSIPHTADKAVTFSNAITVVMLE